MLLLGNLLVGGGSRRGERLVGLDHMLAAVDWVGVVPLRGRLPPLARALTTVIVVVGGGGAAAAAFSGDISLCRVLVVKRPGQILG